MFPDIFPFMKIFVRNKSVPVEFSHKYLHSAHVFVWSKAASGSAYYGVIIFALQQSGQPEIEFVILMIPNNIENVNYRRPTF